jgi:hypothetical protein
VAVAVEEVVMLLLLEDREDQEEVPPSELVDTMLQQLVAEEAAMEIELLVALAVHSPMAPRVEEAVDTETQVVLTVVQEELVARAQLCQ